MTFIKNEKKLVMTDKFKFLKFVDQTQYFV